MSSVQSFDSGDPTYLRLICDQAHDGAWNMAVDEFLLRNQIQQKGQNPILRFYRFSEPTITVGYGMWRSVSQKENSSISFIRRLTGGGIVSHKTSDLTYALIAPYVPFLSLRKTRGSYLFIHETLKRALVDFGVRTRFYKDCGSQNQKSNYCFESPVLYDVMLRDRKVAGAGQKRTAGYLLHQGSIAWDLLIQEEPKLLEAAPQGLSQSYGKKSIDGIDFCRAFSKHLAKALNLSINESPFCAEELESMAACV